MSAFGHELPLATGSFRARQQCSWNTIDLQKAGGMTPFSFNGEEPQSAGEPCTGLALQYFFDGSQIQVNVVHFRIGDQWYRMYFEPATVFWRKSEMPEPAQNTELTYGLLLNDLTGVEGFVGHAFQGIAYQASERGDVEVDIAFSSGRHLKLAYNADADHAQVVNN